jgi:hypothetical protein
MRPEPSDPAAHQLNAKFAAIALHYATLRELSYLREGRKCHSAYQGWQFLSVRSQIRALTSEISFHDGGLKEFHFLIRDFPAQFGTCLALAIVCWIGYYSIRRLRTPKPHRE